MKKLGTPESPSMYLHPLCVPEKRPSTTPATTWPTVMNSVLSVTSLPRMWLGAASAMYTGVVKLARPIPTPTTSLCFVRKHARRAYVGGVQDLAPDTIL